MFEKDNLNLGIRNGDLCPNCDEKLEDPNPEFPEGCPDPTTNNECPDVTQDGAKGTDDNDGELGNAGSLADGAFQPNSSDEEEEGEQEEEIQQPDDDQQGEEEDPCLADPMLCEDAAGGDPDECIPGLNPDDPDCEEANQDPEDDIIVIPNEDVPLGGGGFQKPPKDDSEEGNTEPETEDETEAEEDECIPGLNADDPDCLGKEEGEVDIGLDDSQVQIDLEEEELGLGGNPAKRCKICHEQDLMTICRPEEEVGYGMDEICQPQPPCPAGTLPICKEREATPEEEEVEEVDNNPIPDVITNPPLSGNYNQTVENHPNGSVTTTNQDENGTEVIQTENVDGTTTWTVIENDGTVTTSTLDEQGEPVEEPSQPEFEPGQEASLEEDVEIPDIIQNPPNSGNGTEQVVRDPDGTVTVTRYDDDGHVVTTVNYPDGNVSITVQEPDGKETSMFLDSEGRPTEPPEEEPSKQDILKEIAQEALDEASQLEGRTRDLINQYREDPEKFIRDNQIGGCKDKFTGMPVEIVMPAEENRGTNPLEFDERLNQQSEHLASNMYLENFTRHDQGPWRGYPAFNDPEPGRQVHWDRANAFGYPGSWLVENVQQMIRDQADQAMHIVSNWICSPAHNANLLYKDMQHVGISVSGDRVVFIAGNDHGQPALEPVQPQEEPVQPQTDAPQADTPQVPVDEPLDRPLPDCHRSEHWGVTCPDVTTGTWQGDNPFIRGLPIFRPDWCQHPFTNDRATTNKEDLCYYDKAPYNVQAAPETCRDRGEGKGEDAWRQQLQKDAEAEVKAMQDFVTEWNGANSKRKFVMMNKTQQDGQRWGCDGTYILDENGRRVVDPFNLNDTRVKWNPRVPQDCQNGKSERQTTREIARCVWRRYNGNCDKDIQCDFPYELYINPLNPSAQAGCDDPNFVSVLENSSNK